jgi:ATP-dependent helicase HrpB
MNQVSLPILQHRDEIRSKCLDNGIAIVSAPPGTGKSTLIPTFFLDDLPESKRIYVLEPRRIAAVALAERVAEQLKTSVGDIVGYSVRFDKKVSERTKIVFITYGTFLQILQSDPLLPDAAFVIFDEFHERSVDIDATLAWVSFLQKNRRPDLRLLVLSATLEIDLLKSYLKRDTVIHIESRLYDVNVMYQSAKADEPLFLQVQRAFLSISHKLTQGSCLVFLPGKQEIESVAGILEPYCKKKTIRLLKLHGSLSLKEQHDVLSVPELHRSCILSTNLAETSLTVSGIIAVIDSGYARIAAYDIERDRNTLYLSRISKKSAIQRAGRAGRLQNGFAVRLWSEHDEISMAESITPEIQRIDCASIVLMLSTIFQKSGIDKYAHLPTWLTSPDKDRLTKALADLERCGAVRLSHLESIPSDEILPLEVTPMGMNISSLPTEPLFAKILLESKSLEELNYHIDIIALLSDDSSRFDESTDLLTASDIVEEKRSGSQIHRIKEQLFSMVKRKVNFTNAIDKKRSVTDIVTEQWVKSFYHRLAVRSENTIYLLYDSRSARLIKKNSRDDVFPEILIALQIHEAAGKSQVRQVTIPLYLSIKVEQLAGCFPDKMCERISCVWDEKQKKVKIEKQLFFENLQVTRLPVDYNKMYNSEVSMMLAQKISDGIWDWKAENEKALTFVNKMRLVDKAYPEMGLPQMNDDDWMLIFTELSDGKCSIDQVKQESVLVHLRNYIGKQIAEYIDNAAPDSIILPSGRKAKIHYPENAAPEISARIGDFIGCTGKYYIIDKKVECVYNILAPNYRTVQKTDNISSFWKNLYPQLRKEYMRQYPKHPWPEVV